MFRLTSTTRRPVQDSNGQQLGHLLDLTVLMGPAHPRVHRLVVGHRRRISFIVDFAEVLEFEQSHVQLRGDNPRPLTAGAPLPLGSSELRLVRDVLDTQIVDCVNHRVERVAEVLLLRTDNEDLEVAAVDVGFGAMIRRLGLRRLADRLPEAAIDWGALHLTSDRGHMIQLGTPASAMQRLDASELAHLLALLSTSDAAEIVATVDPNVGAAALDASHPEVGTRVALALDDEEILPVLEELPPDAARRVRGLRRDRAVRRRFERHRGWHRFAPSSRRGRAGEK